MSLPQPGLFDTLQHAESADFLKSQLITYIGNKRALLPFIGEGFAHARRELGKNKVKVLDLFAGTGIVSRMARQYANVLIVNDLETYSRITNECYMTNRSEIDVTELRRRLDWLRQYVKSNFAPGFISELYAPQNENCITPEERVFYTRRNATFLDTVCRGLAEVEPYWKRYLIAPILAQASMYVNTSGVFKGFYKNKGGVGQYGGDARNALTRIMANIEVTEPILSNFECDALVCQADANTLIRDIELVDVAYFDPPYNQHPYGSNYFMLNLLCNYERPSSISKVSGIPDNWNRSAYNKPKLAHGALFDAVANCKTSFVLISYNSEGFIDHNTFLTELERVGRVSVMDTKYNTFRGSRNLRGRDTYVTESLYLVDKR